MVDYLEEDPVINSQKFGIMSYILPRNDEKGTPMIKFRGAYSSVEDCESRIKKLQTIDQTFNIFVFEVGKWGALLTDEQIRGNEEINEVYQNEFMNQLVKSRQDEEELKNKAFEDRKEFLKKKAIEEGTAEGQAELAQKPEHPISVRDRLEKFEGIVQDLKVQLKEAMMVHEETKKKYAQFSEEELQKAEEELKGLKIEEVEV